MHRADGSLLGAFDFVGTTSTLSMGYRSLLHQVFAGGAHGIVMLHNHPSGVAAPSANDVASTASIAALCRMLEVVLHDHLIIGANRLTSLRRSGLLDREADK